MRFVMVRFVMVRRRRRLRRVAGLICLLGWSSILAAQVTDDEWFVDLSADSDLRFVYHNGMSDELYFAEMMGGGAALIDYDGDGDLDVFLVQGSPLGAPTESATGDLLERNQALEDPSIQLRSLHILLEPVTALG